jgi:ABC-type multidrug transport system ATPase subunit
VNASDSFPPISQSRPIIEADQLVKAYGLLPVLRGLTLDVPRGQFLALLGANGSGKSTLIRLLTGLARPTAGILRIGGWTLPDEAAAVRNQIGLVSHRLLLYENLTAQENLRFFGRLYNLSGTALDERIAVVLEQVGLYRRRNDLARHYSRGMSQRLSIARALLHNPDVLLLDEPHTGLDATSTQTLDNLLADAKQQGRTIVMATHQFDKTVELADRAVVIARGVIGYDSPTSGLNAQQLTQVFAELV